MLPSEVAVQINFDVFELNTPLLGTRGQDLRWKIVSSVNVGIGKIISKIEIH